MEFMARVCISKSELTKSSRDLHTEVASSEMTRYVWGNFPGLIGIIKGKHHFILNIPTLRRASTIAFRIAKEEKKPVTVFQKTARSVLCSYTVSSYNLKNYTGLGSKRILLRNWRT